MQHLFARATKPMAKEEFGGMASWVVDEDMV